jgi:hypothetical protein
MLRMMRTQFKKFTDNAKGLKNGNKLFITAVGVSAKSGAKVYPSQMYSHQYLSKKTTMPKQLVAEELAEQEV